MPWGGLCRRSPSTSQDSGGCISEWSIGTRVPKAAECSEDRPHFPTDGSHRYAVAHGRSPSAPIPPAVGRSPPSAAHFSRTAYDCLNLKKRLFPPWGPSLHAFLCRLEDTPRPSPPEERSSPYFLFP